MKKIKLEKKPSYCLYEKKMPENIKIISNNCYNYERVLTNVFCNKEHQLHTLVLNPSRTKPTKRDYHHLLSYIICI